MADYTKQSGVAGLLMVRDLGNEVQFFVYTSYRLYWNNLQFSVNANGTTYNFSGNYNGTGYWLQVGAINVTSSQSINFNLLTSTGTTSLGGPTSMSVALDRGSVPGVPGVVTISNLSNTSLTASFARGSTGGLTIDFDQIGWGTNPAGPTAFINLGVTNIGGLTPGTTYYFWSRTHNAKGYSGWSARTSAATKRVPDAPYPVTYTNRAQTSVHAGFIFGAKYDGGSPVLEWNIGWGTSPTAPTAYVSGSQIDFTGLDPGVTYYFWSRGRNAYGWGPLSTVSSVITVAGAYVKVGDIWKPAVPYVNVGGVWKMARPWCRVTGVWKEAS